MPKLVAIQVLRALAALAVALVHIEHEISVRSGVAPPPRAFPWEAGVDVFFVISGFVMVYASGRLFGRAGAARTFLARRLARIAPLYWLTTSAVLVLLAIRPDLFVSAVATPRLVLASYAFIPLARPDGFVQPVYSLGWTLNYEMFFYVLFALALWAPRRRAVALVCGALACLVLAGLAAGPLPQPLGFWTSPILVEFGLGMGIGLARAEGFVLGRAARALLALAGIAAFAAIGGDAVRGFGLHQAILFALPAALLVAACGLAPGQADEAREPMLERAGEALGDASYAIYLLHPFAVRGVGRALDLAGLGTFAAPATFTALALAASIAVALATYRFVERPLTRLARLALERGQAAPPARTG